MVAGLVLVLGLFTGDTNIVYNGDDILTIL
jgi:hypothetical protein